MAQNFNKSLLKSGEVLDDLQINNKFIIQNRKFYCFTSDSVLLANFVKAGVKDNVLELCSGSGVISILVNEKCNPKKIVGIELDKNLQDMSVRSLMYNNINNIDFVCDNAKNILKHVKRQSFDVVMCNPPYFVLNEKEKVNPKYLNAKYETTINIDEVFSCASNAIKFGGKFFLCFTPNRVQELLTIATKYSFTLKKMQFIYPTNKKNIATLVLCMFVKNGNKNCNVLEPKFV